MRLGYYFGGEKAHYERFLSTLLTQYASQKAIKAGQPHPDRDYRLTLGLP